VRGAYAEWAEHQVQWQDYDVVDLYYRSVLHATFPRSRETAVNYRPPARESLPKTFELLRDEFIYDKGYVGSDDIFYFPHKRLEAMLAAVTKDTMLPFEKEDEGRRRSTDQAKVDEALAKKEDFYACLRIASCMATLILTLWLLHFIPGFY
jgi:hypothetical protein